MNDPGIAREAMTGRVASVVSILEEIATASSPAVFATSFGAEDMVLLDLISKHAGGIEVFTLDTGRLPEETYRLMSAARGKYPLAIRSYCPDTFELETYIERNGPDAFYNSVAQRKECCRIRKVGPLGRALSGKKAWVTGLRREQSPTRDGLDVKTWDEVNGLFKFNPLLDWSWDEVQTYISRNEVPYNELHDRGVSEHRLRSMHASRRTRRGHPFGPLVVGGCQLQRMRSSRWREATTLTMTTGTHTSHLAALEDESIFILREVAAEFQNPVILYSIGKDSSVLVHLARKAFHPAPIPFPLLHIDTGYKFKEMLEFRDRFTAEIGARLIVHRNEEAIASGSHPLKLGVARCCGLLKTTALLQALEHGGFDAAIGGARRDEERSPREGARVLVSGFLWAVGSQKPASGTLAPVQCTGVRG